MGRKITASEVRKGMRLRRTGKTYVWDEETQTASMQPTVEIVDALEDAEEWGDKYAALSLRVVSYEGPESGEVWTRPGHEYSDGECRRWAEFEVVSES